MNTPPNRRLARIATLSLVAVALVLLVFAAGPAHFALHLDGGHADCSACHIASAELNLDLALGAPLELVTFASEALHRAPITAAPWSAAAPRAPPIG